MRNVTNLARTIKPSSKLCEVTQNNRVIVALYRCSKTTRNTSSVKQNRLKYRYL